MEALVLLDVAQCFDYNDWFFLTWHSASIIMNIVTTRRDF